MMNSAKNSRPAPEADYYDRYLEHYASKSNEKAILRELLLSELNNVSKRAFLDVGPGEGELTVPVSRLFRSTTILETNPRFIDLLESKIPDLHIIDTDIMALKSQIKERYDLILLSHVLYYVDVSDWNTAVDVLYSILAPRGMLAVVLNDDRDDWGDLVKRFKGKYDEQCEFNYMSFSDFISRMQMAYSNTKVIPYASHLTYKDLRSAIEATLDQLLQIKRGDQTSALVEEVKDHLSSKTRKDGSVILNVRHKILILYR